MASIRAYQRDSQEKLLQLRTEALGRMKGSFSSLRASITFLAVSEDASPALSITKTNGLNAPETNGTFDIARRL